MEDIVVNSVHMDAPDARLLLSILMTVILPTRKVIAYTPKRRRSATSRLIKLASILVL